MNGKVPRVAIPLILLMCACLYLVGNGRVALWDRDEPRYAMASRWMAESGDWVVPRIGWGMEPETPRTKKPVMTYWWQATAMRALGPTVFAARLPSAVATTGLLCFLAWVISRRLSRAHAFWAVLVLGTSAMLAVASKMSVTDPILLLFVTIGQVCLLAIYRGARQWWVPVAMWVAIGLGGLTKGPVVLGIQITTMVVLAVIDGVRAWREGKRGTTSNTQHSTSNAQLGERPARGAAKRAIGWWTRTRPLMGLVILAVVCGPWLYLVHQREPTFLTQAVSKDVIERMKQGQEGHSGPPGYYLVTLLGTFFPWSLLLPLAFVVAAKRMRLANVRFAVAAVIGPWILMELVQTKLVHYVLPIFPALAYLVAEAVLWCLRGRHDGLVSRVARVGVGVWGAVVMVAAGAIWVLIRVPKGLAPRVPAAPLAAITVAMALTGGLAWWGFANRRPARGLVAMGVGFAAVVALAWGWFLPRADFLRLPTRVAAELVADGATRRGDVLMTDYKEQSLAFYQGGTIDQVWENFLATHDVREWPTWIVLTPKVMEKVPADKAAALERVGEFNGFNYASGKWVDVWVMRKKGAEVAAK